MNKTTRHYEDSILLYASPQEVFDYIDDHSKFSSHMNQASWMMGGGSMNTSIDDGHGQRVGSHIRMSGKILGINLFLDEVVTLHESPRAKIWETVGEVKLLVCGSYSMSINVEPKDDRTLLRVSIDYALPDKNAWLGRLFGGVYAKWCVQLMIKGTRDYFLKHNK